MFMHKAMAARKNEIQYLKLGELKNMKRMPKADTMIDAKWN
ncbi:hypothetical protein GCM10027592_13590 [Spirosoma flavus]